MNFIKNVSVSDRTITFSLTGAHDYVLQADTHVAAKEWVDKIKSGASKVQSLGQEGGSESDEFRQFTRGEEEIKNVYALNKLVPNTDHFSCLRFLRARKGNIEDAAKFLLEYMQWRERTFPVDLSAEIIEELRRGKYYSRGRDKDGHLLSLVRVKFMPKGSYKSVEVATRAMIWCFEWVCNSSLLRNPMDTVCFSSFLYQKALLCSLTFPLRIETTIPYTSVDFDSRHQRYGTAAY